MSSGVRSYELDPIRILIAKYPRLVIIKAAFNLFKEHKSLSLSSLERFIKKEFEEYEG